MAGKIGGLGFLLIFGLFWTAIVGVFDVVIARGLILQMLAEHHPTVIGEVTHSDIEVNSDSDGTTYDADIHFTYEVDGVEYRSETWRYGSWSGPNRDAVQELLDRYPVGGACTVHYDPDDPASAVLEPGVSGMDMFLLLFITPFNLVMVWIWSGLAGSVKQRITEAPAGGAPLVFRPGRIHVRLPRITPLTAAGVSALGVSFVSIFVLGFSTGGAPPMWAVGLTWGIVIVLASIVYVWRTYVVGSGAKDLIINTIDGVLSLPQTFGRKTDVIVPFEAVASIDVERIAHRGSKGGTHYTYAPRLHYGDERGDAQRARLADWSDAGRAEELAQWLRDQIPSQN
jgi:hypothetical protein